MVPGTDSNDQRDKDQRASAATGRSGLCFARCAGPTASSIAAAMKPLRSGAAMNSSAVARRLARPS